ncbi:hypothetical protein RQP46_004020 [Phenoliferia psychrophenolica]
MIRIGLLSPLYVLSISILGTVGLNCSDLARVAPSLIPNASVYAVQDYPANTTFKAAPEFAGIRSVCVLPLRSLLQHLLDFQGSIRGLASSTEWSGRFAMVGNGGDSGGVNFPDMGVPLSKSVYSKRIIKAHYGKQAAHNYWIGCSSGGKQGLKEVQAYPNEFDGVIAGAAAQWWTHLQAASYRQNFLLDSVASPGHLVANDTALIGPGFDYFEYQILNKTTVGTFDGNEMVLEELLKVADATDPGQANAIEGNIQSFLRRYPANLAISDGYRLFPVPGMNHCGGGTSASSFGAASQLPLSDGGLGQSSDFDKDHDMILAMIAWVEEGIAPDVIIGTKYINDTKPAGIEFQRKLCPHPKQGKFIGGDSTSADSFKCL